MQRVPCQKANTPECPVYQAEGECYEDRHHLYYPASDYPRGIQRRFRLLPENVVEMCRNLHNIEHVAFDIPTKPPLEVMKMAVQAERQKRRDR